MSRGSSTTSTARASPPAHPTSGPTWAAGSSISYAAPHPSVSPSTSILLQRSRRTVVGVANKRSLAARLPGPVEPVEVDVGQQWRYHAALRGARHAALDRPVLHHSGAQHGAQKLKDVAVTDPCLDRLHQPVMRDHLKAIGDVRLDTHRRPFHASSTRTWRASCAARRGRNPNEHGRKSASKI